MHPLEQKDLIDLHYAKKLLENPGIAAKLSHLLGAPIEKGYAMLPGNWHEKMTEVTRSALTKVMHAAVLTIKDRPGELASRRLHKFAVATAGGIGGFWGLPALAIELPVSTAIMMRSIADIARSEAEPIHSIDSKMACLEVFALGGPGTDDDSAESGYFAVRTVLSQYMTKATEHIVNKGMTDQGAPALVRMIIQISQRFSIQVSEKAAAQAIPVIGAVGGATINTLFMNHFQDMARGHFIVRRLERTYGSDVVEKIYNGIDTSSILSIID